MSYQVIARKWRPNIFSEVIGQGHIVKTLENAISGNRVGHAYLFSGPRGVGKTTVARILAKSLNCVNGPTPTPCNECDRCKSISSGYSVDVLEIDGASNTQVENVRELRESVRYAPSEGRYKIYIIDEVHMLSRSAFNALLKTLEEPPSHVVFMFATTEPHRIPLTIHSRCQRFDFKRISLKQIHAHLLNVARKEGIDIEEDALYSISRESEGSLRDAQSLMEQVAAFAGNSVKKEDVLSALGLMDRTVLFDLTDALIKGDVKACLNIVEKIHNFGYDLKKVTGALLEEVRNLSIIKVTGDILSIDLPESEIERLRDISHSVGLERLEMLFSVFAKGYEELSRSSTPRFSFEMTLLKASHLGEVKSIGELVQKFEGLRGVDRGNSEKKTDNPSLSSDEEATADGFLNYINGKDKRLFKFLKESQTISLVGSSLMIGANAENAGILLAKEDVLKESAREFFKKDVKVEIKRLDENTAAAPRRQSLQKDPLMKDVLTTFGGRVIEERRRGDV